VLTHAFRFCLPWAASIQLASRPCPLIPASPSPAPAVPCLYPPGMLTFLRTDGEPGLQICTDGQTWRDVPPIEGAFHVNLGDMLCRWGQGLGWGIHWQHAGPKGGVLVHPACATFPYASPPWHPCISAAAYSCAAFAADP